MIVKPPKFVQRILKSFIWRHNNEDNNIWLTFDDGPDSKVTPFILQILKIHQIKATFFLVGEQISKYPEMLDIILNDGHIVANHSYSHKNGWFTNTKSYVNDVEKCQFFMPGNKLYRPPYGKITPIQTRTLKKKYKIVLWDVLSYDFSEKIKPKKIKENIIKNTTKGSIIVLHNNSKSYNNLKLILHQTILELKQKGFNFSTTW